jgi:hypothetical protein
MIRVKSSTHWLFMVTSLITVAKLVLGVVANNDCPQEIK